MKKKCEPTAPAKKRGVLTKTVSTNWKCFCSTTSQASFKSASFNNVKKSKQMETNAKKKLKTLSKVVALDCEMVADSNGQDMLARVSIVDYNLNCVYDKYVQPTSDVVDYRTKFSGIRPDDLKNGQKFSVVQEEVKAYLRNKILVGHSLQNDFNALRLGHHVKLIRDTSLYKPFREISSGKTPSLRKLTQHFLKKSIQEGEHNSIEDASAAMELYKIFKKEWEKSIFINKNN